MASIMNVRRADWRGAAASALLTFAFAIASPAEVDGLHTLTLDDGRERRYFIYRPDRLREPATVVLVLHGSGGSAARIRTFTDGASNVSPTHTVLPSFIRKASRTTGTAAAGLHRPRPTG